MIVRPFTVVSFVVWLRSWADERHLRPSASPMLRLRLDTVMPTNVGELTYLLSHSRKQLSEIRLHVRVLPLRVIVGQAVVDMIAGIVKDVGPIVTAAVSAKQERLKEATKHHGKLRKSRSTEAEKAVHIQVPLSIAGDNET